MTFAKLAYKQCANNSFLSKFRLRVLRISQPPKGFKVRSPQSAVHSPQSAVRSPQSAVRGARSAVRSPQSAVRSPQSAVCGPRSAVRGPQSAVCGLQSAVPQSVFYSGRVNRHKRCLFRRYARRRTFITKARTIILFTNTTLNRSALGEQLQGIFTSETMKGRTCECTKAIQWELNSFPM